MTGRLYRVTRDLHLYLGLFVSPYVLVFSASVFFLVHAWLPGHSSKTQKREASDLPLPANLESLAGRERIDALRPALNQAGVKGEVGWIQHLPKEHQLILPVTVPGRVSTLRIDLVSRKASIEERNTGLADALVVLHKSPGPHLVNIRKNWVPMRIWSWLADATVYVLLFTTLSGIYLWLALRSDRRTGTVLLLAGAVCFITMVYAIVH